MFLFLFILASCHPYEDPDAFTDPRIKDPYCNDPSAVNYNWNFPGVPDNSTCIYPGDVFAGSYLLMDTVLDENLEVHYTRSFPIAVSKIDSIRFKISGYCAGVELHAHTNRYLKFTLDSLVEDGQALCDQDTITGGGEKLSFFDSTGFYMDYEIYADTGMTRHHAKAVKQ